MSYADLHTNFRRSFLFLQVATEQLRQHSPSVAEVVRTNHLEKLQSLYDHYVAPIDCSSLELRDKQLLEAYTRAINGEFQNIKSEAAAPPGLGQGIRPEIRSRVSSETPNGDQNLAASPPFSDQSMIRSRQRSSSEFGAIGGERASSGSITRPPDLPLHRAKPSWRDAVAPQSPNYMSSFSPTSEYGHERTLSETETIASSTASALRNLLQSCNHFDRVAAPLQYNAEELNFSKPALVQPTAPATSITWASIAAIPNAATSESKEYGNHITTSGLTEAQKRWTNNDRRASDDARATETPEEKSRAVWILHLPRHVMTLQQVSSFIAEGSLFSLNIEHVKQTPNSRGLPKGSHACAIFRYAESAKAFIEAKKDAFGPGSVILPGSYDLNIHLRSMDSPTHCRRRVKWSRSKMFYDITLARFKADVLKLCGGPDMLEQIHFYNPGEVTAVFASVIVAKHVVRRFKKRYGKKGHRYAGVECSFCHDFNESPATLWTQFDSRGKLRQNRFDGSCGLEGCYSGPSVNLALDHDILSEEEFEEGELEEIQRADDDL